MLPSNYFVDLYFMFKSLIHLDFFLLLDIDLILLVFFPRMSSQLSQHLLLIIHFPLLL